MYNASPKQSVSCASAVLFLLCVSRYVLFLLCVAVLLIVLVRIHIAGVVPTFVRPSKIGGFQAFHFFEDQKKPGFRYRKPRLLLRESTAVTVFSRSDVLLEALPTQFSLATPVFLRGMPNRWRRSHRHLRLTPSLRANSVSVMWS